MTPLDLMPRWSGFTVRVIVGAIPATVAVAGSVVICFLALFMPERHQQYALKIQAGIINLARVLVGAPIPENVSLADASEITPDRNPGRRVDHDAGPAQGRAGGEKARLSGRGLADEVDQSGGLRDGDRV